METEGGKRSKLVLLIQHITEMRLDFMLCPQDLLSLYRNRSCRHFGCVSSGEMGDHGQV